jgi:DNA polymerase-3 subunit alpha
METESVSVADEPAEPFVHLHTHTEYSLLDGAARIGDLVATAKRHGQAALAITDHGALYGAVKFYTAARAAGVKPIIGCEMYMAPRSRLDKEGRTDRDPNHLILLARNETGYRNLIQLVSRSHLEGYYYKPRIDKELLAEHADGLICLSACIGGELPQAILGGDMDAAESVARQHMEIFGPDGYFLELMDHSIAEEEAIRTGMLEIARRTGLPLVATNDAHYIDVEDAEAHDILLCIQTQARREDEKRFRFAGPHFSVTSGAHMRDKFAAYGEAVRNTLAVADLCNLELKLGGNLLPAYSPIPEGHSAESYLRELCEAGLRERYGDSITTEARERLAMELDVIATTGFAPYFLIVWDLIRAARCDGVVVGPGRGSSAGSLVAYVLRITNVCPLRYGLIFERFLNIERVQMPDIDIDFDDRRRDRVLHYVQGKYGEDRVAQIITFGTMAARAAIRDVGRALNVPLPDVDRLAKLVPLSVKITLDKALDESRELRALYDGEGWARQVIDNARRLEGICRNASTHAAGVVIGAEPLTNIVPLQRSTMGDRSTAVTMFDMEGVSAVGLLKVDFLGLTNLTVIEETLQMIEASTGTRIDIDQIPLDDPATYALLSKADTHGIFQLEATFAKRILLDMQPRTLEDVALAGALNRPGPIEGGATAQYIKRKRGELPVEYPVGLEELLRPVLEETHGTIVYQDQVMKIAQAVAGFTLGEADVLRAAMGKKDKTKMAKQREKFLAGAAARGVAEERAIELFDLIAFFAGYGFNKCVVGDTEVVEARTGERATVADLYESRRPFQIHSLGDDGVLRPRDVTDVVSNGRRPVLAVTTAQGRRIRATANHRFMTEHGWQRLDELSVGDRVATARRLPVSGGNTWPTHELILLGGLLSEGNTCHPSCLYYYNNNRALIDDFVTAASEFPGTFPRIATRPNGRMEVCLSSGLLKRSQPQPTEGSGALVLEDAPMPVRSGAFRWAGALGLVGCRASEKFVPSAVFELTDECIAVLLGRMWAGDGFIAGPGNTVPFYATSSHRLARDVQLLLLRLGIQSGLHTKQFKYRDTVKTGYTVHLVGDGAAERFLGVVGPHCVGREPQLVLLAAHHASTRRGHASCDTVPARIRETVDTERRNAGLTWIDLQRRSGVSMKEFLGMGRAAKRGFRRSTLRTLAGFFASELLAQAADSDVFWDRITEIRLDGIEETYDLTVDVDHNFLANDLVVHNSHSVAYGLISYQTAYLKANHPIEYMAALLNSRGGDFDKLKQTILDAHAHGLVVHKPDINRSGAGFTVGDRSIGEILFGLQHVKNVGDSVTQSLIAARDQDGPFTGLVDLCLRVDSRDLNRRVLESLIQCGALDPLGDRHALLRQLDGAMDHAAAVRHERDVGQTSLFGDEVDIIGTLVPHTPAAEPGEAGHGDESWLAWERDLLGMYLSDHPLRRIASALQERVDTSISELGPHLDGLVVQVGGSIRDVRAFVPRKSTTGQRMAFLQLEDLTGVCEVVVFNRVFEEVAELLRPDAVVIIRGKVEVGRSNGNPAAQPATDEEDRDAEPAKIRADAIFAMDDARLVAWRRNSTVHLRLGLHQHHVIGPLHQAIAEHGGDSPVVIHVEGADSIDDITLAGGFSVEPGPGFERAVEALLGAGSYRVETRRDRAPERETWGAGRRG